MTRFYTTMSARDMTLDPDFDLNPSLPDVSNQHTLALKYLDTCPGDISGRWEATLQSGTVVKGSDSTWPFNVKDQRMPVNRRVTQLAATGAGMVVKDNTATINSVMSGGGPPRRWRRRPGHAAAPAQRGRIGRRLQLRRRCRRRRAGRCCWSGCSSCSTAAA